MSQYPNLLIKFVLSNHFDRALEISQFFILTSNESLRGALSDEPISSKQPDCHALWARNDNDGGFYSLFINFFNCSSKRWFKWLLFDGDQPKT